MNLYIFKNILHKEAPIVPINAINYHEALTEICLKGEPYSNEYYLDTVKTDVPISIPHAPFYSPIPKSIYV